MNSLIIEPIIGFVAYERARACLHRLGATFVSGKESSTTGLPASTTGAAAVSSDSNSSDTAAAFREFLAASRLSKDCRLTAEDVRRCSSVWRCYGNSGGVGGDQLLVLLQVPSCSNRHQQRRGLRTTAIAQSDGVGKYTGIGKRSGHQKSAASGTGGSGGGIALGRIFDSHQQQQQSPDHSDNLAASASMQTLLRSVSKDLPLDAHTQNAVLLRLVDAYTRGVRDGVGHASSASGGAGASDKQRKFTEVVWNMFIGCLKAGVVIGILYVLITVLNPRDSLSKVMLTDISVHKESSKVRFGDVRGCDAAKKELEDVVAFLKHPEDFQQIGARLPRGVLLVGPPGVGKTMLAKAVAGEAEVPFFQCSGSQFDEVFVGTGAARVRRLFEEAKKAAPCVIFIDEFDSVGGKRVTTTHHPYANQTVNQLLAEMDGFSTQDGIIVLAATNRPEILDSAVTRPGRFDVSVQVQLPDLVGRQSILELYLSKVSVADDVDVNRLAKITIGFSGAQLANVVNQAAVIAALERMSFIHWVHLQTAYNKVRMGTLGNKPRTETVNAMTAAHESGHTIVALYTKDAPKVNHVTILPRGMSLGHTAPLPDEADQYGSRKSQLLAQLDMFMGGQAAEELLFGPDSVTTGCSSDLKQATNIARMMVEKVGMSEAIGVMTVAPDESSQQTLALADTEVKRVLDESRERARKLVREKRTELERLTGALLELESLDHDDILRVVAGQKPAKSTVGAHAAGSLAKFTSAASGNTSGVPSATASSVAVESSPPYSSTSSGGGGGGGAAWLKALFGGGGK